jgi:hypothetical protein
MLHLNLIVQKRQATSLAAEAIAEAEIWPDPDAS